MSRGWTRAALGYCSNVHPGETLEAIAGVIETGIAPVRRLRGLERMGTGLWLAAPAARRLAADARALEGFRGALAAAGLRLHTLNGFPQGGFHAERVKESVYAPDWSAAARLEYTLALARILTACLPGDEVEGTLSTLPLGYRPDWTAARQERAVTALLKLVRSLDDLAQRSGRPVRVCLEPEPGCVLDTTADVLALFTETLPAAARRQGVPAEQLCRHLGLCFDICHQAVMFEDPGDSLERLRAAAVPVGKIQVSSALAVPAPSDPAARTALAAFAEPRYLHQVRARGAAGDLTGPDDLPAALADPELAARGAWRVHFHVPLHAERLAQGWLETTRPQVLGVLDWLAAHPTCHPHLEVETYTWQVLPPAQRPRDAATLSAGIAAELAWLEQAMTPRDLLAPASS